MNATKILLVEDDVGHQQLLVDLLRSGCRQIEVEVVSTGGEALRAARDRPFDCILLDFSLPDTRADELLPDFADDERFPPVIVISSSRDQDTAIRSLRTGCADFLPKLEALNGDNLWRGVERALRERRQARTKRRQLERRMDRLESLAETDPLTGLLNRRSLDRLFEGHRVTADRRGHSSVVMIDVDHFKEVNDTHGHDFGDTVLRAIANTMRQCARRKDTVYRYGGEEFVIIEPLTPLARSVRRAELLREKISQLELRSNDRVIRLTASIGVCTCASRSLGGQAISQADAAMYLAKRRGRNRVCTWQMVLFHEAAEALASAPQHPVENRLRTVLTHNRSYLGATQWDHLTTHSEQVSRMAIRLGQALGVDQVTGRRLGLAGLCHDLGKFLIPEDVLAKPGPLRQEERALVRRHSADGAEMSLMLGIDPETADYIRLHHARHDELGTGNVDGRPVPAGARILAVADALAAMTSDRPYQPGRSYTSAVRELQRESGRQFDPNVVAAVPRALLADRS